MVGEDFLAPGRSMHCKCLIIYRCNYPNGSNINSQKAFHVKLAEELVQLLLNLRASTDCSDYLNIHRGKSATGETHLKGKHFPLNSKERKEGDVVCVAVNNLQLVGEKIQKLKSYRDVFLCLGSCFSLSHSYFLLRSFE